MALTNNHNIPQEYMNALNYDTHLSHGDISVTQLITPPQIVFLKKKFRNEIKEDAVERLPMLWGTGLHKLLEDANMPNRAYKKLMAAAEELTNLSNNASKPANKNAYINAAKWIKSEAEKLNIAEEGKVQVFYEKSLSVEMLDLTISGTADKIENFGDYIIIEDHKLTKVFSVMFEDSKKKWEEQLNCYAYMAVESGMPPPKKLIINASLKDWNQGESIRKFDYPKTPFIRIEFDPWPIDKTERFMENKLREHIKAWAGNVRECDGEDRWATASEYVVMEEGKKNAKRGSKCQTEEEARQFIKDNITKLDKPYIELRNGEDKRCNSWCPVSKFCEQYRESTAKGERVRIDY